MPLLPINKGKFSRRKWVAIFAAILFVFTACYQRTDSADNKMETLQQTQGKDLLNHPYSEQAKRPYNLLNPLLNWLLDEKP